MTPPTFTARRAVRGLRAALAAASLALLASCGGGSLQETFQPTAYIVFGDEQSALLGTTDPATGATYPTGRKYGFNEAGNCNLYPTWTQYLTQARGVYYDVCSIANTTTTGSITQMLAVPRARVAETVTGTTSLTLQVDKYVASGVSNRHLVLVMAGTWDIIDLYRRVTSTVPALKLTLDEARVEATRRGVALAAQINRLANAGPRVINLSTPNVGYSPWALAEPAGATAVLSELTKAFNNAVQINQLADGRKVGWYDAASQVDQVATNGTARANLGINNIIKAACANASTNDTTYTGDVAADVNLPACTTLVPGIEAARALWAGAITLGPTLQVRLGAGALTLLTNNPF